jgi:ComF family protein
MCQPKLQNLAIRWLKNVQFWLLPGTCVLCRQPSGQQLDLCEQCHASLPFILQACRTCGLPLSIGGDTRCGHCLQRPSPFQHVIAPLAWGESVGSLVSQFKYQARLAPGRVLGSMLLQELRLHYQAHALPQLVVPVPLHPSRLRRRGYNQSLLLARQLATGLDVPCSAGLVRRIRSTLPQQGQSREERQRNLLGAFALDGRLAQQYKGVHSIAIVDDVVTTLSTAREVASVLQAGLEPAPAIHLWALARA